MASSNDRSARHSSVRVRHLLHGIARQLEACAEEVEVNDGDGDKDASPSAPLFKRASAVQKSPLLSLAPEIRNMVWKLCLRHPEDLITKLEKEQRIPKKYGCLTMNIDPGSGEARPKVLEGFETSASKRTRLSIREHSLRNLALMQTCQDVYNETAPFLWSQPFCFPSIMQLQTFLFSNARLDLVRDISVLRLDRQLGVNHMPATCALLADKVKGLERFDVDMSNMDKLGLHFGYFVHVTPFGNDQELRQAGVHVGFDIYSCMYPWVTKVVHDQGIEKLMAILRIPRKTGQTLRLDWRIHNAFRRRVELDANQLKIANTATAEEILRLVNHYDK
ncbi:hypothetical protein KVR01_007323 [Diaporthe batatas]|uniref:uncharacterized protein n=1 Tax=Diaporthe batatas TaxID=748121 RepID=UPI001D053E63|nr:uncharacterized protein KVR01_007323 [Diaporthe batatas]KAG8162845.1 hypothetical protein KVR01_007323 [Diaporthe batatas]